MGMIEKIKSKIKRFILKASGGFDHLKEGVKIDKRWYGNSYGGFYASPGFLNENSIIYSFGIGEDLSFDEAIIKSHNPFVFGFDPTPKSINWIKKQSLPAKFLFLEYGISNASGIIDFYLPKNDKHVSGSLIHQSNVDNQHSIKVKMKTISDITRELGHDKIDLLKMDIEGAEYQVLDNILNSNIPIDQILLEFHDRFFDDGKSKTVNAIEKLKRQGYEIFGVSDSLEEISFISKKIIKF